jgi:hypothetical protein
MVMKETCESVKALEAFLHIASKSTYSDLLKYTHLWHLQVRPDIEVAAGNFRRADENVTAEATCAVDSDRVLTRVSCGGVQSDLAALIAVGSIYRPCRLVPAAFKAFGYLGNGGWCQREHGCKKSGLSKHDWKIEVEADTRQQVPTQRLYTRSLCRYTQCFGA